MLFPIFTPKKKSPLRGDKYQISHFQNFIIFQNVNFQVFSFLKVGKTKNICKLINHVSDFSEVKNLICFRNFPEIYCVIL